MRKKQHALMIAVDAPYAEMVVNGYSDYIFRDVLLTGLSTARQHKPSIAYIYETTPNGSTGRVIGEVQITGTYCPLYKQSLPCTTALVQERFTMVKTMYYRWCEKKGLKPNPKEGWFKSKKFKQYHTETGFYNTLPNYALILHAPMQYSVPVALSLFADMKGEAMTRPPKNMCLVDSDVRV